MCQKVMPLHALRPVTTLSGVVRREVVVDVVVTEHPTVSTRTPDGHARQHNGMTAQLALILAAVRADDQRLEPRV